MGNGITITDELFDMRCFQCQIGNHDNCLATVFDMGQRWDCSCWECTDADKAAAKVRDEKRKVESWVRLKEKIAQKKKEQS